MNITESNDYNVLLRFFLDLPSPISRAVPDEDAAMAAAARLADRANKALGAGMTGADVAAAWPYLDLPGDDDYPGADGPRPRPVVDVDLLGSV